VTRKIKETTLLLPLRKFSFYK